MTVTFYLAAAVALISTFMVITRLNAIHALLYLIVSLLAVALIFFVLGGPLAAALEVIIYAGAIMVLFVFVVMMLNLGKQTVEQERQWLSPGIWKGPTSLAVVLLGLVLYLVMSTEFPDLTGVGVGPKGVSMRLLGPYLIGVELASLLLLPGLIAAYHLGRRLDREAPDASNPG